LGVIIKQSIKNAIISYVGIGLGFVITILLFPYILTTDQYGLTRLLISLALIAAQIAHLGIKNIIIRFLPYFRQSRDLKHGMLFLAITVPLVGFIFLSLLYFIFEGTITYYFQDDSALFAAYHLFLLPLIFGVLFFEVLNSYLQALQDSVTGSFVNEVAIRVLLILLLGVYYLALISFTTFMIFFVLIYTLQPVYLAYTLYRQNEFSISIPFRKGKRRFAKIISKYGVYALFGGLSTLLVGNIDILMLSSLTDLTNTAIYFIAFSVGSVINVPQRSISKISVPVLAGFIKNKEYGEVESLYRRTSLNQLIAGSLLLVGVWANMHNLMYLLPPQYQGIEWVIIIIGIGKLVDMASGINGNIIMNSKHYNIGLYIKLCLVILTVITNYLLIPTYGIEGAALATSISLFVYNLLKFIFVWATFSMQPFRWNSLAIMALAVGCLMLSFQLPYLFNFFVDLMVRSIGITILFIGAILLFNLSNDVKNLLQEIIRRIKKREHI